MTRYKSWGLAFLLAFVFAGTADAGVTAAPLTGGTIHIKFGVAAENADALPTVSISVRRIDTGTQVFCADVAFDATEGIDIVEGDTAIILNDTAQVLLEGVAWSEVSCGGLASLGSTDTYHVVFAIPGRPVMLPFTLP